MTDSFTTVRTVGALLPPDLLARVVGGDRALFGLSSSDYHLGGSEVPREAANRTWAHLLGCWTAFRAGLASFPEGDPAVGITREKWHTLLFQALGYGRLTHSPPGGIRVGDRTFAVSHEWSATPINLLGWGVDLDRRTPGVAGAAGRAPHAVLQELLNRSDDHLWGIVTNGRLLRILRDTTSLSGQSYVEFDLEALFDGEVFSDFVLLYLLVHQSRVEILSEGAPPSDCWLERWRTTAAETGTRALGLLRDGVKGALETLGTGFLRHPANASLNRALADGDLRLTDYHQALLRLVYRLLFLFVAEDRDALFDPAAGATARSRYANYFSSARLRRLSLARRGDRHTDAWQALTLVMDSLGLEGGQPELGLPGLGGLFDKDTEVGIPGLTSDDEDLGGDALVGLALANQDLYSAIRSLSVVQPKGQPKRLVDYRNLGSEELGGIYESLLELVARHDNLEKSFTLEALAGNERKTSGSYYTPTDLIDLMLDETLDPLLDDAEKTKDPEAALLAITVCDPACGSAHFLVAAARRIASRLASARTGDLDPTPLDFHIALHDVIGRCIYGVDVNPMAAELARVSLWLEALQQGRPMTFLDNHIRVGNALLGATPALLAAGIPDLAFAAIEGDDKGYATALRKRNRAEREAAQQPNLLQEDLFDVEEHETSNSAAREALADLATRPILSLVDLHLARRRYREIEHSPGMQRRKAVADAWCAAFVQQKSVGSTRITQETLVAIDADSAPAALRDEVNQLTAQYRFFHWHLEFPEIFETSESIAAGQPVGWSGGFTAVIGNPPWERIKLQEQEFFASKDPAIANAPNAARRKKLIAALAETNPQLHAEFNAARRQSEGTSHLLRDSGRYPLCGVGDVNTYSVFAEHMRTIIRSEGRMGVLTPTGLATDNTTAAFFADLLRKRRLAAFYDFENEAKIFPGVDHRVRFAVTSITGGRQVERARLAFVARHTADVPERRFELAAEEILLINPNTGTLPVFRTRLDADITLGIYRRHPVLIRDDDTDGNPWGLSFARLFDMANDSGAFFTLAELEAQGDTYDGWAWIRGDDRWLPLYEAKMLSHYDHRFATYAGATQAQLNVGSLPRLSETEHDDQEAEPLSRYWVSEEAVRKALSDRWTRGWLLGWRDIARASDARTMVPSVLPRSGVGHVFPIAMAGSPDRLFALQAIWSSFVFDFVARQKLSGTHMTYSVLTQLACPPPHALDLIPSWLGSELLAWTRPRLLELNYTSYRLAPYATDMGDHGAPFRWVPERRGVMRAELDAACFHLYGLMRGEAEHVLDSFSVIRKYDERDYAEFRTKRLVLERYDAMTDAMTHARQYESPLDPVPGDGPRHDPIAKRWS